MPNTFITTTESRITWAMSLFLVLVVVSRIPIVWYQYHSEGGLLVIILASAT